MKRINLILCFGLISMLTYAQKFETNLNISPIITFGSNKTTESKLAFGVSSAIQEFFNISERIAIGTELNYSYTNYRLKRDYNGAIIPENEVFYESKITIQSLNIPFILKYNTQKNWILEAGHGLTYIINSKTKVDYVCRRDRSRKDVKRIAITDKYKKLDKDFNSFLYFGFGKGFNIRKTKFNTEIYYETALQEYTFGHASASGEEFIYKVKPQQIGLKIGIEL